MPLYTLVGGPCDGQTVQIELNTLERNGWRWHMPGTQTMQINSPDQSTVHAWEVRVTATYRLDDGANSTVLQHVRNDVRYAPHEWGMQNLQGGHAQNVPGAQASISWQSAWDVVQREMERLNTSVAGLLNPVFHRERVPVPTTILDSMSGVWNYAPGPVTVSAATHAPGSGRSASYVWIDETHQINSGGE